MELGVMVGALVDGLGLSAWIFVVTLVGSLPLGIVVALCRMSSFKPLSLLAQFYISILRGTPLMLQLMAFMFGPYCRQGYRHWSWTAAASNPQAGRQKGRQRKPRPTPKGTSSSLLPHFSGKTLLN